MIIEEALENLTESELEIHEKVKDVDESALFDYISKRLFYKEPSESELNTINDLYERGTTSFNIKIQNKDHRLKLLSQFDKSQINELVDKEFNGPTAKRRFTADDLKNQAMIEFKMVAIVAAATEKIDDSTMVEDASSVITKVKSEILGKTYYMERLPMPLIKTLYDRYIEFENRIFDIFSFESVKKKSEAPSDVD